MDRCQPRDRRCDSRQAHHDTIVGGEHIYDVPDSGYYSPTIGRFNPRFSIPSSAMAYPSHVRPNPAAEYGSRQLSLGGYAHQHSVFAQFPGEGSCGPSYHGPRSAPNAAYRAQDNSHSCFGTDVNSRNATGGSTFFKAAVQGTPQTPQYWPQTLNPVPDNSNDFGLAQDWSQLGYPDGQNSQYGRPQMVPSPRTIHGMPRKSGSLNGPDSSATTASLKGYPDLWNQGSQRGMDRSSLIPEDFTAAMHRPSGGRHSYDTSRLTPTVPVLEKSRSGHPKDNSGKAAQSLNEDHNQDKVRDHKPRKSKSGKHRKLTAAGRDHAKAIRQLPGGACTDCKRKKTKAGGSDENVCLRALLTLGSAFTGYPRIWRSGARQLPPSRT
jgi:hypothetical protein